MSENLKKSIVYKELKILMKQYNATNLSLKKWVEKGSTRLYWNKKLQLFKKELEEQREEERKRRKKDENKHKEYDKLLNDLSKNKEENITIDISNESPDDLLYVLNKIKENGGKYILSQNGTGYTLNSKTLNKLIVHVDEHFIDETGELGSDAQICQKAKQSGSINIYKVQEPNYKLIEGSAFDYMHLLPIDLTRYQIANKEEQLYNYDFSMHCFPHALKMAGIDEKIYTDIQMSIKSELLPRKQIKEICDKYNLRIDVKRTEGKEIYHYGLGENIIEMGLIDHHYFIIDKTNITKNELIHMCDGSVRKDSTKVITSFNLIKYMIENKDKYLIPIVKKTKKDFNIIFDTIDYVTDLSYDKELNLKPNKYQEKERDEYTNIFFDCESTTVGTHKCYLIRVAGIDIDFNGEDAGYKMLKYLSKIYKKVRLIAHNATYDIRVSIFKFLNRVKFIERGTQILHGESLFWYEKGKFMNIQLQDSYALIPTKLKEFTECFGLDDEKEYMPYYMYTEENIKKQLIDIKEFEGYEHFKEFSINCNKWDCINENKVDILKYSSKYCAIDCEVLRNGYNTFKKNIMKITGLNIDNYVSTPSIANSYMEKQGVFDGIFKLNGKPREFIQKCVVGGRVMTRKNKKAHITENRDDFDAVSLYPSAMFRLGGYLKGSPKVITNKAYENIQKYDGYFVKILILKIGKKYSFPLSSYIDEETGVRNFTNDMEGKKIYIDKIALEELITYHKIEFEVLDGYYFDEGRNTKLGETIKYLFEERAREKKAGNPIQNTYKLLMNSAYGKTLLKPYEVEVKYMSNDEADVFIKKNYEHIQMFTRLANGRTTQIKKYVTIDEHFNNVHCGVEVLSMSKRIMNEVMCLAEDLGIIINYQDTDSMHIESDKVKLLSAEFKKAYGRNLIGSGMGQFHSDFSMSETFKKEHGKLSINNIKSIESYYLGKKCYIDKLEGNDEKGNKYNDYHIRMKGVSNDAILHYANQNKITPMDIYEKLFNSEKIVFDLTCGGDKMICEYTKAYQIETRTHFNRKISF